MAQTVRLELTQSELNYIAGLIEDSISKGNYWGNKEQFYKRQHRVLCKVYKLSDADKITDSYSELENEV